MASEDCLRHACWMISKLENVFFSSVWAYLIEPSSIETLDPERDPHTQSTPVHEVKSEWNTHMIIIKDWSTL